MSTFDEFIEKRMVRLERENKALAALCDSLIEAYDAAAGPSCADITEEFIRELEALGYEFDRSRVWQRGQCDAP